MGNWRSRAVLATVVLSLAVLAPSFAGAAERPCNGSVELCDRALDQVVLPGTHNSMSSTELNWQLPNQTYTMPHQLDHGARALLFDTHYGVASGNTVAAVSKAQGKADHDAMYFCHEYCELGDTELTAGLKEIADWMAAHPREVLMIVNEDYVDPDDFAQAVSDSGMLPMIYKGATGPWPTLEQMIDTNQRIVMFAQDEVGDVPWYHLAYDGAMRETPYTFPNAASLTDPAQLNESCRPNRGGDNGSLFLMNNWVQPANNVPKVSDAQITNTKAALVARAQACKARRGIMPTILATDYFGTGDEVGAAQELNGVTPKPYLEVSKPKAAVVKAGKKATFKLSVANYGDLDATGVKVCATLPSRLARKPKCATLSTVPLDNTPVTATISVITKKTARGLGTVKFTVSPAQVTPLSTSSKLRVKPLPKKNHKKHHKRHRKH